MNAVWAAVTAMCERDPDREITVGTVRWSMQDLVVHAEELAESLRTHVPEGGAVTLSVDSPLGGLVGVCAALAADRAFVPVAAPAPACTAVAARVGAARHVHICEDASADLLTHAGVAAGTALAGAAYAITTSGSTGVPKVVMVDDTSLLQRLRGLANATGFGSDHCILAMAALTFDISLVELLLPLVAGGRMALADPFLRIDPTSLAADLQRCEVTHLQATPSYLRLAGATGWAPTVDLAMWVGGEVLSPRLAGRLLEQGVELWNVYGPTETTLWATADRVEDPERICIGTPLPGLDVDYGPCVDGMHELVISGEHLSLGYLDPSRLDAARFSTVPDDSGTLRMTYRTGDLVMLEDGVRFRGRVDDQVKIRGQRIELGGLERVAEAHPLVQESAAVVTRTPEEDLLVMHVVAEPSLSERELRAWLNARLPREHAPNVISWTPRLPRTTSGKVDRRALSSPTDYPR